MSGSTAPNPAKVETGEAAQVLADQLRVLDEARGRVDDAGYQDAVIGDGHVGQRSPLVAMPRVGRLEQERTDVGA